MTAGGTYVDAHCHLDLFANPRAIIGEIETKQIEILAVTNLPSLYAHTLNLSRSSKRVRAAAGFHPELVVDHSKELASFEGIVRACYFIGEIGLDYSGFTPSEKQLQRKLLSQVLQWCTEPKLFSIHSRKAAEDVIAALSDYASSSAVILHWFTGNLTDMRRALAAGMYFSINPGMLRSRSGSDLVKEMPIERILTESDGPLAKTRGRSHSPASAQATVALLADILNLEEFEVADRISKTWMTIARLPESPE